jgi:hypothetical protein
MHPDSQKRCSFLALLLAANDLRRYAYHLKKKVVMIQDKRNIQIKSSPEIVFDLIETMPNKFPIYKILETKPSVFLRLLLVDGGNLGTPLTYKLINFHRSDTPFSCQDNRE